MITKDPANIAIEDLLTDDSFINFVSTNNEKDTSDWERWLKEHPEMKPVVSDARQIYQMLSLRLTDKEYVHQADRLKDAMQNTEVLKKSALYKIPENDNSLKPNLKRNILWIAASVVGLIIFALYFIDNKTVEEELNISKENNSLEPYELILQDNTKITLFANSSIKYPENFSGNEREVYLQGNAHFEVTKNEQKPFIVHTRNLLTTVLGTIFTIQEKGIDSVLLIELLEGKVKISLDKKDSLVLLPNESATFFIQDQTLHKNIFRGLDLPVDNLAFKQADFNAIASTIHTISGVTLINESNKTSWKFSGEFEKTTIRNILENICLVEELQSRQAGDTVFLK